MKTTLFQEKFTILHIKKGSVETSIIIWAILCISILPFQIFVMKTLSDYTIICKVKEILQISSVNTFQAISGDSLGRGNLNLDKEIAEGIFTETADDLFSENCGIIVVNTIVPEFTIYENNVVIKCAVKVENAFGKVVEIFYETEFTAELS